MLQNPTNNGTTQNLNQVFDEKVFDEIEVLTQDQQQRLESPEHVKNEQKTNNKKPNQQVDPNRQWLEEQVNGIQSKLTEQGKQIKDIRDFLSSQFNYKKQEVSQNNIEQIVVKKEEEEKSVVDATKSLTNTNFETILNAFFVPSNNEKTTCTDFSGFMIKFLWQYYVRTIFMAGSLIPYVQNGLNLPSDGSPLSLMLKTLGTIGPTVVNGGVYLKTSATTFTSNTTLPELRQYIKSDQWNIKWNILDGVIKVIKVALAISLTTPMVAAGLTGVNNIKDVDWRLIFLSILTASGTAVIYKSPIDAVFNKIKDTIQNCRINKQGDKHFKEHFIAHLDQVIFDITKNKKSQCNKYKLPPELLALLPPEPINNKSKEELLNEFKGFKNNLLTNFKKVLLVTTKQKSPTYQKKILDHLVGLLIAFIQTLTFTPFMLGTDKLATSIANSAPEFLYWPIRVFFNFTSIPLVLLGTQFGHEMGVSLCEAIKKFLAADYEINKKNSCSPVSKLQPFSYAPLTSSMLMFICLLFSAFSFPTCQNLLKDNVNHFLFKILPWLYKVLEVMVLIGPAAFNAWGCYSVIKNLGPTLPRLYPCCPGDDLKAAELVEKAKALKNFIEKLDPEDVKDIFSEDEGLKTLCEAENKAEDKNQPINKKKPPGCFSSIFSFFTSTQESSSLETRPLMEDNENNTQSLTTGGNTNEIKIEVELPKNPIKHNDIDTTPTFQSSSKWKWCSIS